MSATVSITLAGGETITRSLDLIAAAPDLLGALKVRAFESHEQEDGRVLIHCGLCNQYDGHRDTCLIAKAEGVNHG